MSKFDIKTMLEQVAFLKKEIEKAPPSIKTDPEFIRLLDEVNKAQFAFDEASEPEETPIIDINNDTKS